MRNGVHSENISSLSHSLSFILETNSKMIVSFSHQCANCLTDFFSPLLLVLLLLAAYVRFGACLLLRARPPPLCHTYISSIFVLRIPPATKAINQVSCYIYCFTVLYGMLFFFLLWLYLSPSLFIFFSMFQKSSLSFMFNVHNTYIGWWAISPFHSGSRAISIVGVAAVKNVYPKKTT